MSSTLLLAAADVAAEAAEAAASGRGMVGEVAHTFGVNPQLLISQIISFCVVAFLLHRFAYKPVLAVLEERRQRIQEGLDNAEKIKAELARTEEARKAAMVEAGEQATKLINDAKAAAAQVLEKESQKAMAAANEIVERARQSSEAELARMKEELRQEVGRLVVETTAKVTGKVLTVE
ncbi:MAG: F0F1 ATP synthase subunit B, partial [Verrucomicrobiae bacterium]|nr:F0F1 ATP synthase subunit B [Verrucomicrobiae bacterium]